jgi:hypothetical protein
MNGYAALHKKLMFDKFPKKLIQNKPAALPELEGIRFDTKAAGVYDLVLAFVFSLGEMEGAIRAADAGRLLAEGAYLYLAYPKRGNKEYRESIHRDEIFPALGVDEADGFVEGTSLKFSKMAALNETFTIVGLRRFTDKNKTKKNTGSRAEDYAGKIPELRAALKGRPKTLARYDALSPGYQKDWARQVYGAKTEATREKRLEEMAKILAAGFKSKDLYRLNS